MAMKLFERNAPTKWKRLIKSYGKKTIVSKEINGKIFIKSE